jgi:DNA-binding transcriptional LysR family regulator
MYDWADVKFFLATARAGSTLAAARQLGVNQTTVARRISALEAALSVRLFDRNRQGYRVSQVGTAILEHAGRMADEAEALQRLCAQRSRNLSGVVRVTTSESIANTVLTPLLTEFMELHPHINVEVITGAARLDLSRGEADVAIRAGRMPTEAGITVRKLADDRWSLFCSSAYAAKYGAPESPEGLNQHVIIGSQGFLTELDPFIWLATTAPSATVRMAANTIPNALAAIRAGQGVGPLPRAVRAFEGADLIECFALPSFELGYYLLARRDIRDLPHMRAFTQFIVSHAPALKRVLEGSSTPDRGQIEQIQS